MHIFSKINIIDCFKTENVSHNNNAQKIHKTSTCYCLWWRSIDNYNWKAFKNKALTAWETFLNRVKSSDHLNITPVYESKQIIPWKSSYIKFLIRSFVITCTVSLFFLLFFLFLFALLCIARSSILLSSLDHLFSSISCLFVTWFGLPKSDSSTCDVLLTTL